MRLLGFVAAAGFVIATATPASANCIPNKTASTFQTGLAYWTAPGPIAEGTVTGQFWQLGNRAGGNEGLCTPSLCGAPGWLYYSGGLLNVNAIMGSAEASGCPTGNLITVAQVNSADGKSTYFIAGVAQEDPTGTAAATWAYGLLGDKTMAAIPRPRVLSQSRVGSQVTLHIQIPDASGGQFGVAPAITGYRLVSGNGAGTADSGREGATYTTLQTFAGPQADVTQIIDCTGIVAPAEKFVGLQILFDSGASQQASRVGATYRVGCDPSLAAPKTPIAPKKGPGVRQVPTQN
jgi:hypothetical protein